MAPTRQDSRAQLVFFVAAVTILTHFLSLIHPSLAANGSGSSSSTEAASSTQPLWSYQVKPTNYVGSQSAQTGHYAAPPSSIFDAFTSLSQRQGALTSSPFMSILPIILIAAGGLLLLLPMLTMMMASPFGGGGAFGGGYGNAFGYPQVGALSKRRSLDQHQHQRGLIELIEHVSTTIEDLSRKYARPQATAASGSHQTGPAAPAGSSPQQQVHKRAKSLNSSQPSAANEAPQLQPPSNHKTADEVSPVLSNVVSGL